MRLFKKKKEPVTEIGKNVKLIESTFIKSPYSGYSGTSGASTTSDKFEKTTVYLVEVERAYSNDRSYNASSYSFDTKKEAKIVYDFFVSNKGATTREKVLEEKRFKNE